MTGALIGRDHPAGILHAEIGRAVDSHGGLVLVTGEAGIGKSTLVTAAADEARRLGALVLGGTCWDSAGAPDYWPWVQVIRGLRRGATPEEYAAAETAAGSGLAVLLGESQRAEGSEGFALYDAVTTALVSVSHSRPVVVVLEDLHWADTASLRLLEFAAQHTWFERLVLIGTYRDVEVEAVEHPLRPVIVPLLAKATTISLTGLDRDEVGALITATVGRQPEPDLVAEVHRRTGGNPFFVEQTARLWHSGGSLTAIPPGVRHAVQRRLSQLPGAVRRLLTTAAVLGREFDREVLAAAVAEPVPQAARLLDEAVAARLVVAAGGGRFGFTHDLLREALHDELAEAEAARLHAAVVRAVTGVPALAGRMSPADLANHAWLAGAELDPATAVDLLLAAARAAGNRMAADEALRHQVRAYQRAAADQPRRRFTVALDAGRGLHHAGRREDALRIFAEAAALARELDDAELLARAALTVYGAEEGRDRPELWGALVEEAYRTLVGERPDGDRSPTRLAQDLALRVMLLAERSGDDEALEFSLWARHNAIWGPGSAPEREAVTAELLSVARRTGDHGTEFIAASLRWVALLEQGDPGYLDQFHELVAISERGASAWSEAGGQLDRTIIATLTGRFKEAEALLDTITGTFGHAEDDQFAHMVDHVRWALLLRWGRFEDLDEQHRRLLAGQHPCPRLLMALAAVQSGNREVAVRHLADVTARGVQYSRFVAPIWVRFLAQTAAATRDPALCERARAELAPYAGEWAIALYGCDVGGPMVLWSAVVDAAQQRWDEAIDGFTAAAESADRLQARPWAVEARGHLAEALLARGRPGDAEAAARLRREVEREAAELGLLQPPAPATVDGAEPVNEFRFTGEVWTLTMSGRTIHLPDAKGLRDIHLLLGSPDTDVPAVELLALDGGRLAVAARRFAGDAVLDEQAKISYRRRLSTLDEEIDRAAVLGDDRRAAELDRERAALLDELRAAAGLAGRTRRLGDETERARKAVTARIRDTLRKLDERHPELAEHLRATISTGLTCRYQPRNAVSWVR
ncbi:ATP-binding protein [Actinophytocola sp.]|uniref:ATP-binding protein n=1 Tax=Actinophytocola sp. TaxID=1872138 RepID=UPI002D7EDD08|nr:AAA family ATPase [Actinophytocola sp.]HET9143627.1 AAA family ATPase [Actinophytocola sp.]